jgi:hypothetical protein
MYAFDTHTIHYILYTHRMRETVEDRDQGPLTSVPAIPPPTLTTPRVLRGLPTVADGYLSGSQTERKHRDRVRTESVSSAGSSAAEEGFGGGVRGTGGMTFQETPGTSHGRRPRDAYEYSPLGDAGAEIKRGADNEEEEEDVEGVEKNGSHKTRDSWGAVVGRVVLSPVTVVPSMPTPPPAVGVAFNRPSSSVSTSPPPGISIRYPSTPVHLSPQPPKGSGGGGEVGDETVTQGVQKASPVYPSPPPLRDAAMAVRERERARGREREVQREKGREASQTKPDEQRRSPSFQPFTSSWDKCQQLFEAGKEAEGIRASADGGWRVCADGAEDVFAPGVFASGERAPYYDAQLDDAGGAEDGGARTGVETQVLSQDTPCGVSAAAVQARLSPSPSLHPNSHVALEHMQAQKTSLQGAVREADAILSTPSPRAGSAAGEREGERQREVKPASTSTAQVQVARQVTNGREFAFATSVHAAMSSLFLEVCTF